MKRHTQNRSPLVSPAERYAHLPGHHPADFKLHDVLAAVSSDGLGAFVISGHYSNDAKAKWWRAAARETDHVASTQRGSCSIRCALLA